MELTEARGEVAQLGRVQHLVLEEQNLVAQQRSADCLDILLI